MHCSVAGRPTVDALNEYIHMLCTRMEQALKNDLKVLSVPSCAKRMNFSHADHGTDVFEDLLRIITVIVIRAAASSC